MSTKLAKGASLQSALDQYTWMGVSPKVNEATFGISRMEVYMERWYKISARHLSETNGQLKKTKYRYKRV